MATIPVTLTGVVYSDRTGNPPEHVTFVGEAHFSDLAIGGGPARPGMPVDPGWGQGRPMPPVIWPGPPPVDPGYTPPGIVVIPPGAIDGERPTNPIYLPVYPDNGLPDHGLPEPPDGPPPQGYQWVFTHRYGWVADPVGGGKPMPLPPGGPEAGPKRG